MRENLYLKTAQYYDGGNHRSFSEDIDFYRDYTKDGFEILDVGCGTGRVALELLDKEVHLTCIDLSPTMLAIFRDKVSKLPESERRKNEILEANMLNYSLDKKFDLIIFPFNVFQAVYTNQDRNQCLQTAAKHLNEDGKIIINAFNPNPEILANFESNKKQDYQYFDDELNATVTRYTQGLNHEAENQVIETLYTFDIDYTNEDKEQVEEKLKLGYQTKEQMDKMFENNNLKVENLYAWWDKSPYREDQKKSLIYVLKK